MPSWRDRVRTELRGLVPYRTAPPQAPIRIRLDSNESPWPLPHEVRTAMAAELSLIELNRYPNILADQMREWLAADLGVSPNQLLFGHGSDEIIFFICNTF